MREKAVDARTLSESASRPDGLKEGRKEGTEREAGMERTHREFRRPLGKGEDGPKEHKHTPMSLNFRDVIRAHPLEQVILDHDFKFHGMT